MDTESFPPVAHPLHSNLQGFPKIRPSAPIFLSRRKRVFDSDEESDGESAPTPQKQLITNDTELDSFLEELGEPSSIVTHTHGTLLINPDSLGDFIVDDSGESLAERRKRFLKEQDEERVKQEETMPDSIHSFFTRATQSQREEVMEIFGDIGIPETATAVPLQDPVQVVKLFQKAFEPQELSDHYLTEQDAQIKSIDIPERFQLMRKTLGVYKQIPGFSLPEFSERSWSDEDLIREAEWISWKAFPHRNEVVPIIATVLAFLRDEKLEVPFIKTYRREYYTPHLSDEELWIVLRWSERYDHFYNRRALLSFLYAEDAELQRLLEEAESEEDLGDIFQLYRVNVVGIPRDNRKQQYYRYCRDKLGNVISALGISPRELGLNLANNAREFVSTDPTDDGVAVSPMEFAARYVGPELMSAETVLRGARFVLAEKIAAEPNVRSSIRQIFRGFAKLSTIPTERGEKEIHPYHVYASIKRLKEKPLSEFHDDQFLLISKAEREGYITTTVDIPVIRSGHGETDSYTQGLAQSRDTQFASDATDVLGDDFDEEFDKFVAPVEMARKKEEEEITKLNAEKRSFKYTVILEQMQKFFFGSGDTNAGQEWNTQRSVVLYKVLEQHLFPFFEREVREELARNASEFVSHKASLSLRKMLRRGRFIHPDDEVTGTEYAELDKRDELLRRGPKQYRVVACSWIDVNTPLTCVCVDESGELQGHITLHDMTKSVDAPGTWEGARERKKADLRTFSNFLKTHKPSLVAIGTNTYLARKLYDDAQAVVYSLKINPHVTYVPTEIPATYIKTPLAIEEFPEESEALRFAVSIARFVQDPLTEVCSLFASKTQYITGLRLHGLQSEVPRTLLLWDLENEVIDAVNSVGVVLDWVARRPHKAALLQFVSGLGPRKARELLRGYNFSIRSRNDFLVQNIMGPTVFLNSAGFIHIIDSDVGLDKTRIHPESYWLAHRVVTMAMGEEGGIQIVGGDENDRKVYSALLEPNHLDELNLTVLAMRISQSPEHSGELFLESLRFVRKEFKDPFGDPRDPYRDPNPTELFEMITGSAMLKEGEAVNATVFRVETSRVLCRLDIGGLGIVFLRDITPYSVTSSEEGEQYFGRTAYVDSNVDGEQVVRVGKLEIGPGTTISARVREIDRESFRIFVEPDESDPREEERMREELTGGYLQDRYFDQRGELEATRLRRKVEKKRAHYRKRAILHPHFKNISWEEAEVYLADRQQGSLVFRPSSKGEDHLAVSWKFDEGIVVHHDILEEDKPNPISIGRSLLIDGNDYEDLDEIEAGFVEPMASLVRDMMNFRKYKRETRTGAEELLHQDKDESPGRIPYYIIPSRRYQGKFELLYLPSRNMYKQYITVTPDGFRMNASTYVDVERLVGAFKTHVMEQSSAIKRRDEDERAKRQKEESMRTEMMGQMGYDSMYQPGYMMSGGQLGQGWDGRVQQPWGHDSREDRRYN